MNFTDLEGLTTEDLIAENQQLRRSLYIEFANTTSLQKFCSRITTKFKKFIDENLLPCDYEHDILYAFLKENKFVMPMKQADKVDLQVHVRSEPLFPLIRVEDCSKQVIVKMENIGYQHLCLLPFKKTDTPESSDYTSDSDSWEGYIAPLKKKLKTCQEAIKVDCEGMLRYHYPNATKMCGTAVQVDMLIFLDRSVCKELAEYLGLIYIEDLLIEMQESNMDTMIFLLNNTTAKLYRLIQSYINKKLIAGCHNICLTHSLQLWSSINANVRAVISNKDDDLLYLRPKQEANYYVELDKNPSFLQYIEGVSLIIDRALSCDCHVIAKYQCEDSYYKVKLSLIAVLPFYVLQYLTQCEIKKQKHELRLN